MARRAPGIAIGLALAALLAAGLWPFDVRGIATDQGEARVRCGAALIEAWPERHPERGWFSYVPNSREVLLPPFVRSRLCGVEARERIVVPLYATVALLLLALLTGVLRRSRTPESSGDRL